MTVQQSVWSVANNMTSGNYTRKPGIHYGRPVGRIPPEKRKKWKHQSIEVIDEWKLDRVYKGDVRDYLYHEDPVFRKHVYETNIARHKERMKTDPEYKRKLYEANKKRMEGQTRSFTSKTKEQLEKMKETQRKYRQKNPEYHNMKIKMNFDKSLGRPKREQTKTPTEQVLSTTRATKLMNLPLGYEIRELQDDI